MIIALVLIIAYLLGSIPFGLILAKIMGEGDLRTIGSGNIGATNALRTGNKKLAVLTLLLDLIKGSAAVWLALIIVPSLAMLAGLVAIFGHIFPIWLKFKGGKGVATGLGILLALSPLVGLLVILTWLAVFKWKKISSLSALAAYGLSPLYATISGQYELALTCFLLATIIFATHRQNIQRLITGEENTFSKKQ